MSEVGALGCRLQLNVVKGRKVIPLIAAAPEPRDAKRPATQV